MNRRDLNLIFTLAAFLLTGLLSTATAQQSQGGVELPSAAHAVSPPLSSIKAGTNKKPFGPALIIPLRRPDKTGAAVKGGGGSVSAPVTGGSWTDPDLQTTYSSSTLTLGTVFPGSSFSGYVPPDENLSVGINSTVTPAVTQIVQVVNTSYNIYDSSGNTIASGDLAGNLFASMTNSVCSSEDGGDPIALFDKLDSRWIIAQLAYNSTFTDNHYCLAISQTSNAAGAYDLYDIPFNSNLPDYPKLAVWPDGIYFSANIFVPQGSTLQFTGAQACSFPRSYVTNPPGSGKIAFSCSSGTDATIYNILPADLENLPGTATLPTGPDYYLQFVDNLGPSSGNLLALYQFDSSSRSLNSVTNLTVGTFYEACGGGTCVPQAGTSQQLDSLGDRLMYRLSFRAYSNYDQMVVNHAVQVNSSSAQSGIRWYAIRGGNGSPFSVYTESTFSPDSTYYRWMGSIGQNKNGDLGLGYSLSGVTSDPGIAVTGLLNDPKTLMEQEQRMYNGSDQSYEGTYSRWGDYSSISVDPGDDCSFWYTNEYVKPPVLSIYDFLWQTEIGKFNFGDCSGTTFAITTASLPQATVGATYNAPLTVNGGTSPYTWSLTSGSLPAGLTLNSSTGVISGTPTTAGTSSFTVQVTDSNSNTASANLAIIVNPAPSITTSSLPSGTVGTAYSATVTASGGTTPYTWSLASGSLPAGLSLNSSTGVISGTPTTAGTSNFTVKVTDTNNQSATANLSITVNPAPLSITTSSLPSGTVGTAYSATVTATGGTTPYAWSITSGSLPPGLNLGASTGAITGTPTTAGSFSFGVTVTDAKNNTASTTLSITVNPAAAGSFSLSASPGSLTLKKGQSNSYTITITPSGGFTGNVDLVVSGCPTGASCSLVPATVQITGATAVTSLLGVNDNSAARGSFTLKVTGTSEANPSLTSSVSVTLRTR